MQGQETLIRAFLIFSRMQMPFAGLRRLETASRSATRFVQERKEKEELKECLPPYDLAPGRHQPRRVECTFSTPHSQHPACSR